MNEKRRFHWSDLLPDSIGPFKRVARAGLIETLKTLGSTEELTAELLSIKNEIDGMSAVSEQGAIQRKDLIKVKALRARLGAVYARRKELVPHLRENIVAQIKQASTRLEMTELSSIAEEAHKLVVAFEEGRIQREDSIMIEALRSRLSVVYGRQEELDPFSREEIATLIRTSYSSLERLETALLRFFGE